MNLSFLFCHAALARLDDYIDRHLSPEDMWVVEAHLKICHECARKFAFEKSFTQQLREKSQRIQTSPELLHKFLRELPDLKPDLKAAQE